MMKKDEWFQAGVFDNEWTDGWTFAIVESLLWLKTLFYRIYQINDSHSSEIDQKKSV